MVKKEIIEKLKEFRSALQDSGVKVTKLVLYGSYANGHFSEYSDIDVAVVSSDFGKDRFEEGVKLLEIAYKIDPRIEAVPVSIHSYKTDTWVPLIYEIRKKGVEIKTTS